MNECLKCGFWDSDFYTCTCPATDLWFACKLESNKEENIEALKDYARRKDSV